MAPLKINFDYIIYLLKKRILLHTKAYKAFHNLISHLYNLSVLYNSYFDGSTTARPASQLPSDSTISTLLPQGFLQVAFSLHTLPSEKSMDHSSLPSGWSNVISSSRPFLTTSNQIATHFWLPVFSLLFSLSPLTSSDKCVLYLFTIWGSSSRMSPEGGAFICL